jgi:hypothetical protein
MLLAMVRALHFAWLEHCILQSIAFCMVRALHFAIQASIAFKFFQT